MSDPISVVHVVNQFFGGIGGEEKANEPVVVRDGPVGPGRALQQALGTRGAIVATLIGGDNYMAEQRDAALAAVRVALERLKPDAVVAGPAFDAGRYGLACGEVCKLAGELGIPAVTAMHPENPGVLSFGHEVVIVPTGTSPTEMGTIVRALARLALELGRGGELGPPEVDGYLPRGIRKPGLRDKPAAERAIEMLIAKTTGRPFQTELPVELPERVAPAPPLPDLHGARLVLITTGGLVPRGNPDRLVRGNAEVWHRYSIDGLDSLGADDWECVHRGFYTTIVGQNPNYILPLDRMRELQREGAFAELYPWFFSTSGVGTAVGHSKRMGTEMAAELKQAGVDAALLVAT
ncbi:MAG: glycine/betaine/sarcosine/D-proline family reductase selenoprotein B [Chloroflexi bacterium]|nr:glycine/betaine/sarcosine/D-proline family reductase selenoprotein B [Chloroflexota bacterium]